MYILTRKWGDPSQRFGEFRGEVGGGARQSIELRALAYSCLSYHLPPEPIIHMSPRVVSVTLQFAGPGFATVGKLIARGVERDTQRATENK